MKIINIAGTVGKDAVLRRTQSGDPVLGFSVAVDDGYGDNKSTMWFDVAVFDKRAQSLESHITKGMKVTVSGEFGMRFHEDKAYPTVRANDIALQGGRSDSPRQPSQRAQEPEYTSGTNQRHALDDDIPFTPEWRG